MIASILLACALTGEPQPTVNLVLYGHSGDWQFKRLISDVRHDGWICCRFRVWQVERDILNPQWGTGRSDRQEFPKTAGAPAGLFCTRGICTAYLRKELAKHLEETRDERGAVADAWMENRQMDSQYHEPFRDEADRFRAPEPANAPADGG